jgi:hypothetical protein
MSEARPKASTAVPELDLVMNMDGMIGGDFEKGLAEMFKSRAHRDRVNARVMKDPRLKDRMDPKAISLVDA